MLIFIRNYRTAFKLAVRFWIPGNKIGGFPWLYLLASTLYDRFLWGLFLFLFPCFLVVCHSNWCIVSGLFLSEHLTCISMDQTLKVQTLIYWSWPAGRVCMSCLKSVLLCPIHSLELAMKPQKQSQVRGVILSFVLFCFVRFFLHVISSPTFAGTPLAIASSKHVF